MSYKDPEKEREYHKKYRADHGEKIKEYLKKYNSRSGNKFKRLFARNKILTSRIRDLEERIHSLEISRANHEKNL